MKMFATVSYRQCPPPLLPPGRLPHPRELLLLLHNSSVWRYLECISFGIFLEFTKSIKVVHYINSKVKLFKYYSLLILHCLTRCANSLTQALRLNLWPSKAKGTTKMIFVKQQRPFSSCGLTVQVREYVPFIHKNKLFVTVYVIAIYTRYWRDRREWIQVNVKSSRFLSAISKSCRCFMTVLTQTPSDFESFRECSLFTWGGGKLELGRGKLHTPPLRRTKITKPPPFFTNKSY